MQTVTDPIDQPIYINREISLLDFQERVFHLAEDDHLVEMFYDEARLGMRLRHPSLCHFYDVGELEGHLCMAMEWIEGVTLDELLERASLVGRIPPSAALSIRPDGAAALDPDTRAFVDRVERHLQTRVSLHPNSDGSGKLEIRYFNPGDLERLAGLLLSEPT